MYVVYFRAYIILRAHVTLRRGALLFLATFATFAAWFLSKPLFMLLPYLLPFCPFSTFAAVCAYLLPFLLLKRLQRSFYAVFKRFLSGLFVHAYLCTVSPVSGACRALFEAKLPFLGEYRGAPPPKPKRREAQLRSHRNLYFLFPKIFFLENSLSPSASCPFHCQNPLLWLLSLSAYQQDLVEA